MSLINTGLNALQANQVALQVISNNIANANTPAYHRQQVRLQDRPPDQYLNYQIGTGVEVAQIKQIRDGVLEQALARNASDRADVAAQLQTLRAIETLLTPREGSLHERLRAFFDQVEALSARPADASLKAGVVQAGADVAAEINLIFNQLTRIRTQLDQQIDDAVQQVNDLTSKLAALNDEIRIAEAKGLNPNDLRDRRDQLIGELSGLVDAVTWESAGQPDVVAFARGAAFVGREAPVLVPVIGPDGQVQVRVAGTTDVLNFAGGTLGGLLTSRNEIVAQFEQRLQTLASAFVRGVDQVQATGLADAGGLLRVESTRAVADVTAPLAEAGTAFPVTAGNFVIAVTDLANGNRTLTTLPVDPAVDSLQDIAAQISSISHLQAVVDAATGTIAITAESGYAFDFTGQLQTIPDTSGITGTSVPQFSGAYGGTSNSVYQFTVTSGGTVGVTPGLLVEVRDASSALITTLDVGAGYAAGTALTVANGALVQFSAGDLNAGDTFSSAFLGQPDEPELLSALGIMTFFDGTHASGLSVRPELLADPTLLATSITGDPGDAINALRLLALRDVATSGDPPVTFEAHLAETTAQIGAQVSAADARSGNLEVLGTSLQAERESLSGVDVNEELGLLLQFQRAFQASARIISAWDDTVQDLLQLLD